MCGRDRALLLPQLFATVPYHTVLNHAVQTCRSEINGLQPRPGETEERTRVRSSRGSVPIPLAEETWLKLPSPRRGERLAGLSACVRPELTAQPDPLRGTDSTTALNGCLQAGITPSNST